MKFAGFTTEASEREENHQDDILGRLAEWTKAKVSDTLKDKCLKA